MKVCCGGFELGEGLTMDGKVLKASGGSGETLVVNITTDDYGNLLADKTYEEIHNALPNVIVRENYQVYHLYSMSDDFGIAFTTIANYSDHLKLEGYAFMSNGEIMPISFPED